MVGGGLDAEGGTIAVMDKIIEETKKSGRSLSSAVAQLTMTAKDLKDNYASYYLKVLDKAIKEDGYVDKELARLEGLLRTGGLAQEKVDDLTARTNILRKFNAPVEIRKDEL